MNELPAVTRHPRRAPLVLAVIASTAVSLFCALNLFLAATLDCSFAGGHCGPEDPRGPGLVLPIVIVAVAASWASTMWVAHARHRSTPWWLAYLVALGGPMVIGAAVMWLIDIVVSRR